jgi:uncharacterized lipoprotein YmbA
VVVPAYLDRRSILTHEPDGEVLIASSHQWAEPLKDGVTRVVAENLAAMIPTDAALMYPWRSPSVVTYRVTVEIFRFDGTLGGPVVLTARWRLLDKDGNELTLRTVTLDERPVDATYGALVASHSHLLAAVSQDIATAIRTRKAGRVPSSAVLVSGGEAGPGAGGLRSDAGTEFGLGVTVAALAIPPAVGLVPIGLVAYRLWAIIEVLDRVLALDPGPCHPAMPFVPDGLELDPSGGDIDRAERVQKDPGRALDAVGDQIHLEGVRGGLVLLGARSKGDLRLQPGARAVRLGPRRGTVRRSAPS